MSTEHNASSAEHEAGEIPPQEAAELAVPADYQASGSWWLAPLFGLLGGLVLVVTSLTIYHRHFAYKPMQLGVVDVSLIVEAKRDIVHAMLAKPDVSDAERQNALDLLVKVEPELRRVLDEVRTECECELLVKAAALTSDRLPDYTGEVAHRLQVTEDAVNRAREAIQKAMTQAGSALPPPTVK